MRLTPRYLVVSVLLLGIVSGCDRGATPPTSRVDVLERVTLGENENSARDGFFVGMTVPFQVRALDRVGKPVAGVELRFVRPMKASVSPSSAITDSEGMAGGVLSITDTGPFGVHVEASGRAEPLPVGDWADVRRRVKFTADTLRLASVGDRGEIFAQVLDPNGSLILGEFVEFSASTSGIVSIYFQSYSGNTRQMRPGVRAEALGRTLVIATHRSGVADTIVVQVGS